VHARRPPHPIVWTLLYAPFGAISGFVGVTLVFLASKQGMSEVDAASLIAVGMLPHTWKFLWAPVVDMTLSRRTWYLLSAALCIAGTVAMAAVPLGTPTLDLMRAVIFVTNLASTTLGMGVEGLMAHLTPPEERGRVGGWFQAGNLGGAGIGGGFGLWLASQLDALWMCGAVVGGIYAVFAGAVFLMSDVPAEAKGEGVGKAVKAVALDFWGMVRHRDGLLAALICFLPIGTGAASGVLAQAKVAAAWGAGEAEVGMVNGLASGFIAAVGCLAGGELCRRWPTRKVYSGVGALMAMVTIAMWAAPPVVATFIVGGLVYSFVTGLAYAAFTGLVLETIGAGAAATKYNAYAALSNTPIMYMGMVLAWAAARYGGPGMLLVESAAGFAGIVLFLAVERVATRRPIAVEQAAS
jgi:hypothetical protein